MAKTLMSRSMNTSAVVRAKMQVHPGYAKNKAKYEHFQVCMHTALRIAEIIHITRNGCQTCYLIILKL